MQVNTSPLMNANHRPVKPPELSGEQKIAINEILEQYDAENLTDEDAKSIVKEIEDAGITPNRELKEIIESAGFDPKELAEAGGLEKPPRPSGPPQVAINNTEINQEALESLQRILSEFDDISSLSSDQELSLKKQLESAGLLEPGALIDTSS